MQNLPFSRAPLALMISIALLAPVPALAAQDPTCDASDVACEQKSGISGWVWGGAAVLGLGALAAGGGGGGGGSGGGGNGGGGNGGGGNTLPPPAEGGHYGNGQALSAAGTHLSWQQATTTTVTGSARNEGQLDVSAGALQLSGEAELRNTGELTIGPQASLRIAGDADMDNYGLLTVNGALQLSAEGGLDNLGRAQFVGATVQATGDSGIENASQMTLQGGQWTLRESAELDNGRNALLDITGTSFTLRERAEVENQGRVVARGLAGGTFLWDAVTGPWGRDREAIEVLDNVSQIQLEGATGGVLKLVADSHASHVINRRGASISSSAGGQAMLYAIGSQATLLNQGTLNVTGDGAVAMRGERGALLLNDGTINLGTATDAGGRGMIAMQSDGSATLNNRRGGVINIYAADSYAFQIGAAGTGRLINNGVVNLYGQGSALHADANTANADLPGNDVAWQAPRGISGYTVGTQADGSAGRLVLHDGGMLQDVAVDTGFTRGTDASQMHLEDVVVGAEGGHQNIRSATVVWSAHAERDQQGNVDVQMQRNDYRELAGADQQQLAGALENSYRNDALYHSLEVADIGQFQDALKQLSGASLVDSAMRATANADAVWSQLQAQPGDRSGALAFGAGSRLGGVHGEGSAAHVAVPLGAGKHLQLMTGALSGDLSSNGGQDRSQMAFAGVGLSQQWGALKMRHQLGYEQHHLEGQRSLQWGTTTQQAHSQREAARAMLSSTLSVAAQWGAVKWQPRLKASAFSYSEQAFSELQAKGFGLSVGQGRLQGMSLELGSQMHHDLGNGWSMQGDIALIKPMGLNQSLRQASLQGAAEHSFALPGVRTTGIDHRLQLGLSYHRSNASGAVQLLNQRQWGAADRQAQLQLAYRFR